MIAESLTIPLSSVERSQLQQKALAIGAWREGRIDDALLMIDSLLERDLTARVAAECFVAQAAFRADKGDFQGSYEALELAAPMVDTMELKIRGSFYHQRGRVHKELGRFDAALTDYAGAEIVWEQCAIPENQGAAALNIAGCYLALGNIQTAQEAIGKAFDLLRPIRSFYLAQAYDTQAKIFLEERQPVRAAEAIRAALDLAGENEAWRVQFLTTQEAVEEKLLEALQVKRLSDWDRIKLNMVRRALLKSGGNPGDAAPLLGVTRHAVFSFVNTHKEELEPYRKPKRVRRKSILKKN